VKRCTEVFKTVKQAETIIMKEERTIQQDALHLMEDVESDI
jgi:hypothetical protein